MEVSVCVRVWKRERERARQREREIEGERERKREKETKRERKTEKDRQWDRKRERKGEMEIPGALNRIMFGDISRRTPLSHTRLENPMPLQPKATKTTNKDMHK